MHDDAHQQRVTNGNNSHAAHHLHLHTGATRRRRSGRSLSTCKLTACPFPLSHKPGHNSSTTRCRLHLLCWVLCLQLGVMCEDNLVAGPQQGSRRPAQHWGSLVGAARHPLGAACTAAGVGRHQDSRRPDSRRRRHRHTASSARAALAAEQRRRSVVRETRVASGHGETRRCSRGASFAFCSSKEGVKHAQHEQRAVQARGGERTMRGPPISAAFHCSFSFIS